MTELNPYQPSSQAALGGKPNLSLLERLGKLLAILIYGISGLVLILCVMTLAFFWRGAGDSVWDLAEALLYEPPVAASRLFALLSSVTGMRSGNAFWKSQWKAGWLRFLVSVVLFAMAVYLSGPE